jgi:hypothetical protein
LIYFDKMKFHRICKAAQRDPDGKYSPVTTEMVFDIALNHQSRGLELQFRDKLTDTNREILNEIRQNKSKIKFFWLNDGNYLIREKQNSKAIRIMSVNHLKEVIQTFGN